MEPGNRSYPRKIAIEVQYDGTNFTGWQLQKDSRTVQGEIEKAIQILFKEKLRVTAAGRTDAGVHALGQIVHFSTNSDISLQRVCAGLNGILPRDISIKNAFHVAGDFHARFDALERNYRYLIYNHPSRTPFMKFRSMWVREQLDIDYLRTVTGLLVGEMDFSSFCKKRESKNINTVRRIAKIDIQKQDDLLRFDISGNAFLHNMVRILIGTVVEMNKNNADPQLITDIISKRDRDYSGVTAPPYGLYLVNVIYDPALATMDSAF
jgi:tRNA pseudouridine38-40 synthase